MATEDSKALGEREVELIDRDELVGAFLQVASLAKLPLTESEVRVEFSSAPHERPTRLPVATHGVYLFFLGDKCLKVGKAGPKTVARFCHHHYGLHAPSTLAKSILGHLQRIGELRPSERVEEVLALTDRNVGEWIEINTSRMNVLLPTRTGPFGLSLLEAFLHCRLQPMFEGRPPSKGNA